MNSRLKIILAAVGVLILVAIGFLVFLKPKQHVVTKPPVVQAPQAPQAPEAPATAPEEKAPSEAPEPVVTKTEVEGTVIALDSTAITVQTPDGVVTSVQYADIPAETVQGYYPLKVGEKIVMICTISGDEMEYEIKPPEAAPTEK